MAGAKDYGRRPWILIGIYAVTGASKTKLPVL